MSGNGSIKSLGSWVAVFVVGFAIGYGLMALMVDSPEATESSAVAVAVADDEGGDETPTVETPSADQAPAAAEPDPKDDPIPAPADHKAPEPEEPPTDPADPAAAPEPKPEPEPEPEPATWWDQCRGKTCKMDWGGLTGGISVRKGSLTHRATVDWERDFAHTARRGVIPQGKDTRVQVLAVGLDHAGEPAAANVVWTQGGQRLQGVISLAPGDKRITFETLEP